MPQDQGLVSSLRKNFRSWKADRSFERTVGTQDSVAPQEERSRAALYGMEMGPTHRRSQRMQEEAAGRKPKRSGFSFAGVFSSPVGSRVAVAMSVMLFAVVMLYQPVANYYNETRQLQQLEAEYSALQERNVQTQGELDYLSTQEGLEEYAHDELGLIRADEHVVNVEGLSIPDAAPATTTQAKRVVTSIPEGSIATPATWYSPVLDVLFGYAD